MWEELGISGGTAIITLIVIYFVIKWSVKNGIKDITGKKLPEDEAWVFSLRNHKHKDSNI